MSRFGEICFFFGKGRELCATPGNDPVYFANESEPIPSKQADAASKGQREKF